ncbi:MAG TPA: carbohydrate kinase family protein [Roseiflexaceae bacterium]|nr:carbohydrate kinase family protein [Roseiflexaceae bacterium]HMP40285.1 carbohydrate kinase family protein [Roseiflexaceae bacterium]
MRIVVTGSLAYDYIMNFPGYFKDHILPEKVHMLSVSFLVDSMRRMRGGVAGNIAYTLALLGERPRVFATAGHDFGDYRAWLQRQGVDTASIRIIEDEFTASCFFNTDRDNNQIVAFYTGAAAHSRHLSISELGLGPHDFVIISPTDPEAMSRHAAECRQHGIPFLFDPGKQTPRLSGDQILAGLTGASVLVGNDYEFAMMAQHTGKSEQELIESTPLTVVTRGAQGSTIYTRSEQHGRPVVESIDIPIAPIREILDPTGAGDAYLGGLVFGLARRMPLPVAGRIAALAAAYAVEYHGCQEHTYTIDEFVRRYTEAFGTASEIEALLSSVSGSAS